MNVLQWQPVDSVAVLAAEEGRVALQLNVLRQSGGHATGAAGGGQLDAQNVHVAKCVDGRHPLRFFGVHLGVGPADQCQDPVLRALLPGDSIGECDERQPGALAFGDVGHGQSLVFGAEDEVDDAVVHVLVHLGTTFRRQSGKIKLRGKSSQGSSRFAKACAEDTLRRTRWLARRVIAVVVLTHPSTW